MKEKRKMKWDYSEFIKKFSKNTLGRKNTHGSLYIQKFPGFKILMVKSKNGIEIVGMYFNLGNKSGICIMNSLSHTGMSEVFGNDLIIKAPISKENYSKIHESSIIEFNDLMLDGTPNHAILKLGEQYLYYEPDIWNKATRVTVEQYLSNDNTSNKIIPFIFDNPISSIEEVK